jgi:aspartate oxidase
VKGGGRGVCGLCKAVKIKVKVKLSLCLTKHHAMRTYWGSGGIAPRIYLPHAVAALPPGQEPPVPI